MLFVLLDFHLSVLWNVSFENNFTPMIFLCVDTTGFLHTKIYQVTWSRSREKYDNVTDALPGS